MKTDRRGDGANTEPAYKVICISMYKQDLEQLDTMVRALKASGVAKASRSGLIRYALSRVPLCEAALFLLGKPIPTETLCVEQTTGQGSNDR